MAHVGLIGLGLVGIALAERLQSAGHRVTGFDLDPSRGKLLQQLGGHAAASAEEVPVHSDVCFLSLPTSEIASLVLTDLVDKLVGKVVIDTTTASPESTIEWSSRLASRGIVYLDATIVGSSKHVRSGDVLVLVGGDESAFLRHQRLLAAFARQVFYLGKSGSGARMKLVVNLVLGLNRAVLAEGLTFAEAYGVDPVQALEVLRAGLAYSRVMDTKGLKMLQRNFEPEAKLSQHHKDVRLILEAARNSDVQLPLTRLHDELLTAAEQAGYGDADNSAIITAFQPRRDHRQ